MFCQNSICLSARYVALWQRDLYHIENEHSEFISNFAKQNISNTQSVYIDKGENDGAEKLIKRRNYKFCNRNI